MRKIALLVAAMVMLVACSSGGGSEEPQGAGETAPAEEVQEAEAVVIQATEFSFIMPEELPSGESTITFENVGGQPHFFDAVRVQDDVTDAEIEEALQADGEPEWLLGSADGFGLLSSGQSATATATYEPGTYLFVCFMPDTEGTPHAFSGMWSRVTVTDEPATATTMPEADVTVEVGSDGWTLPDLTGLSGEVTFAVSGSGKSQKHSFDIGRVLDESLEPPTAGPALEEWWASGYKGSAPADILGGFSVEPGRTRYLTVNLSPGTYWFHDEAAADNDVFVPVG